MCGRYYIQDEDSAEELRQIIEELQRKSAESAEAVKTGEVFPTDLAPVIANNRDRYAPWQLVPGWAGPHGPAYWCPATPCR